MFIYLFIYLSFYRSTYLFLANYLFRSLSFSLVNHVVTAVIIKQGKKTFSPERKREILLRKLEALKHTQ